ALLGNTARDQPELQPVTKWLTALRRFRKTTAISVQNDPHRLFRHLAGTLNEIPEGLRKRHRKVTAADWKNYAWHTGRICGSLVGFAGLDNIQVGVNTLITPHDGV